jgi:hypothetical protein
MTLNELRDEAHKTATEKGWHDSALRSALEIHMLIVSEIAEATEEIRSNHKHGHMYFVGQPDPNAHTFHKKPEGEAVELADAVIRIADYFGSKGWDLEGIIKAKMDYNKNRSYRHGGKAI